MVQVGLGRRKWFSERRQQAGQNDNVFDNERTITTMFKPTHEQLAEWLKTHTIGGGAPAAAAAPAPAPMTPQQQMIMDAFNSEVYVNNRMDIQHTPLYDTVTLAASSSSTTGVISPLTTAFFTNVGAASGKTFAQTNMSQSQKLAAPEAFSIFGYRFRWSENIALADIYTLLNGFCMEFTLGIKVYQRGPLWYYNAGGGIYGFFTNTTTSVWTNGVPGRTDMHKLAIPIVIENQMTFFALLNGNSALSQTAAQGGTGIIMVLLLDGLYARGVQ